MYEWLNEIGIDEKQAQDMFEWEALYDKFPGYNWKGDHNVPSKRQCDEYWEKALKDKVKNADKVWLLGKAAHDYFFSKNEQWSDKMEVLATIHPSTRNRALYRKDKERFLEYLKNFINS